MPDTLKTRLVFIDTSAYENNNFQFGQHALLKMENFVASGYLYLLITDITIKEIQSHLEEKSEEAAGLVKKMQKDAMFLRNTPELPCHGIFEKINSETIYDIVHKKFESLLAQKNVEIVPIKSVDPEIVFEHYFEQRPPFDNPQKKSEFPDAFALEAVNSISIEKNCPLYIVSTDSDMKRYAEKRDNLIYINRVNELLDLVIRNVEELKEPAEFADSIFEQLESSILAELKKHIEYADFSSELIENYDDELEDVKINSISIGEKNILEVSKEEVEYEIEINTEIEAYYSIADYDRSPWDPEDHAFAFVFKNKIVRMHRETFNAYVILSYTDGIRANAQIFNVEFENITFELSENDSDILSYEENYFDDE